MRPAWKLLVRLSAVVLGVALSELLPFLGQIIQCEDGRDRAYRDASPAVNALDWVDIEHFFFCECGLVLLGMNTIDRTGVDAGSILCADARLCDYVGHKGECVS